MCFSRDNAGWYRRWRARRVPLDERLIGTTGGVLADGPAVRRRNARHAEKEVGLRGGVGRGDNRPGDPVPPLDEGLIGAADFVVADGPALRRRHTCYAIEDVGLRGTGVG